MTKKKQTEKHYLIIWSTILTLLVFPNTNAYSQEVLQQSGNQKWATFLTVGPYFENKDHAWTSNFGGELSFIGFYRPQKDDPNFIGIGSATGVSKSEAYFEPELLFLYRINNPGIKRLYNKYDMFIMTLGYGLLREMEANDSKIWGTQLTTSFTYLLIPATIYLRVQSPNKEKNDVMGGIMFKFPVPLTGEI